MTMEEKKTIKEIDVIALVKKVLKEWRLLAKFVGVSIVLGVIVALCTPREYTVETVLAPELSSGGLGLTSNLADMASNFGIDLDKKSSADAIYPELYPDILASNDFLLQLFDIKVRKKTDNTELTLYQHLTQDTKTPFWELPRAWLYELLKPKDTITNGKGGKDPYITSRRYLEICEGLAKSILCLVDKKTSEISISYTDQDPLVASIVVDTLQKRLQKYITEYRTKKARVDYDYYKNLSTQAKKDYERARDKYVNYADATLNANLQSYVQKNSELENDMQLKYDSYKTMSSQMRQAEAKIQENTPAFTIIQSSMMPYKPSSRPRSVTVLLFIFLGVISDAAWVLFIRPTLSKVKK